MSGYVAYPLLGFTPAAQIALFGQYCSKGSQSGSHQELQAFSALASVATKEPL